MMQVEIAISVRPDYNNSNDGSVMGDLQIRESFKMQASSFTEMAAILGRFHELAEKVKADGRS